MSSAPGKPLIVFDLIATLTDAGPRYAEAYIRMCMHYDVVAPPAADILSALGNKNLKQIIEMYTPDLPADQIDAFMQDCNRVCDAILYDVCWHESLYENVRECLSTLRDRGFSLGIYTGTRYDALQDQLRYHNIDSYFDGRFIHGKHHDADVNDKSDDLKSAQLSAILNSHGDLANITVIGDSIADYEAARRAGLSFIGFAPTDQCAAKLRDAGVTKLFTDFLNLPEIIGDPISRKINSTVKPYKHIYPGR